MGSEVNNTNAIVFFCQEIMWTKGAEKNQNALKPVPVQRFDFQFLNGGHSGRVSSPSSRGDIKSEPPKSGRKTCTARKLLKGFEILDT